MVQTWSRFHFVDRYVEWSTCGCVATCVSACQSILLLSLGTKKDPSLEAEDPWVGVKGQPIVLRERVRNGLTSEEQEGILPSASGKGARLVTVKRGNHNNSRFVLLNFQQNLG